jgi:predicted transcriptional regulator of viral defense system
MHDIYVGPDSGELFALASEQAGYFTTAQARACGYDWRLLSYHAGTGRFIRLRRGLYRLRDYPSSPHEEVMAAWLAMGKDTAVVSHGSALALLGLSDVVPNSIHILIPRSRRGLQHDSVISLHTTTHPLQPDDVVVREGLRLTAPQRTILDVAETGTASEQVIMAVEQALQRGWITADDLRARAHARGGRAAALVEQSLRAA